jgi:hypothetical protein
MSKNNSGDRPPKPSVTSVLFENIPEQLKGFPHWVPWRLTFDRRRKKWTKRAVLLHSGATAAGPPVASLGDDFEQVVAYWRRGQRVDGIGFVFRPENPFAGIDLRHCRDARTGRLEAWADDIVRLLGTYAEVSPSRTRIKLLVGDKLRRGDTSVVNSLVRRPIEVYSGNRFFTVSGMHLPSTPLSVEADRRALRAFVRKYLRPATNEACGPAPRDNPHLSDDEILAKAAGSKAGGRQFLDLLERTSDYWPDPSAADFRLCCMLAFYCGADPERIERLFARSRLAEREEWTDRPRYRGRTTEAAIRRQWTVGKWWTRDGKPYRGDDRACTVRIDGCSVVPVTPLCTDSPEGVNASLMGGDNTPPPEGEVPIAQGSAGGGQDGGAADGMAECGPGMTGSGHGKASDGPDGRPPTGTPPLGDECRTPAQDLAGSAARPDRPLAAEGVAGGAGNPPTTLRLLRATSARQTPATTWG